MCAEHVIVEFFTGRSWVQSQCRRVADLAVSLPASDERGLCAMLVALDAAPWSRGVKRRCIGLVASRERLERLLEIALKVGADDPAVMSGGLACMSAYRNEKDEGLVQAFTIRDDGSRVIVLAGTRRVWREGALKRGIPTIRRRAARLGQLVLLVGEGGLGRDRSRSDRLPPRLELLGLTLP